MSEQAELIKQKLKTIGQRKVFDYLLSSNQAPKTYRRSERYEVLSVFRQTTFSRL